MPATKAILIRRVIFQGSSTGCQHRLLGKYFLKHSDGNAEVFTGIRVTLAHLRQVDRPYLHPAEEKTKAGLGTYKPFSVEADMDVVETKEISLRVLFHCTSPLIYTPAAKLSFIFRGLS